MTKHVVMGHHRPSCDGERPVVIDWVIPAGRPNWLLGGGATVRERIVVWVATAVMTALAVVVAAGETKWAMWQWLVVAVVTIDVAGGVAANALGTAKRFYHSPLPAIAGGVSRTVHHPIGFAVVHVQPFIVAAVVPDAGLVWATTWWVIALAATTLVTVAPLYLQRVTAAAVVTTVLIVSPALDHPAGLWWFGPVLVLKLAWSHSVREEPYRPVDPTDHGVQAARGV